MVSSIDLPISSYCSSAMKLLLRRLLNGIKVLLQKKLIPRVGKKISMTDAIALTNSFLFSPLGKAIQELARNRSYANRVFNFVMQVLKRHESGGKAVARAASGSFDFARV